MRIAGGCVEAWNLRFTHRPPAANEIHKRHHRLLTWPAIQQRGRGNKIVKGIGDSLWKTNFYSELVTAKFH